MHVLTKIFIVLVSLLAVMIVPLVVVYAHNESSYKSRLVAAESNAAASASALRVAESRASAQENKLQSDITELRAHRDKLQIEQTATQTQIRQLESQLAAANANQGEVLAKLAVLASTGQAGQQVNESLVSEVRDLRADAVKIHQEKVELDESVRELAGQLEVAENARRALAEELARVKDEHAKAMVQLSAAIERGFNPDKVALGERGLIPDVTLHAKIVRVERSSHQVLAEIDAGSRHGVKEGWKLTIANGPTFIGNLRIINVDINRATGVVELESRDRGLVKVGHTAHATAGQE